MYPSRQKSKNMYSTAPDNPSYSESSRPQQMENLTDIHTSAPSNSHLSAFQQMDFIDAQSDPRSFLNPGYYSTGRRGSIDTDTIGSQYAWSTASNTDILSNSPHMSSFDTSIGPTSTPFIQGCYAPESAQLAISDTGMGYTPQQIDKWCIESEPSGVIYQPQPFPNMGSINLPPSLETQPEPYPLNNQLLTASEWLSYQLHSSDPIPESFLSIPRSISAPRSVPAPPTHTYQSTTTTTSVSSSPAHSFYEPDSPPTAPGSASGSGYNSNTGDLSNYGIKTDDGSWRCAYKGCSSKSVFHRGCDLRKHFNRHRKHLFCRYEGCPQSTKNGFSSKKDRARHEAKHNPDVFCEWEGCGKVFSRVDNMKDHVRRIHRKGETGRA
ncbi:Zinc finger, C2H2 [Penicillium griseofulvum]|uniref:Zinc finger, C2H2 n=1 Tax=Penicillium patulum TaxID=5078 RepID=A0A135LZZ4_PENPA|nr:Zinc finger, C2H2 [Penicillium griseofulvum]KXG54530.1 Zinc finger, C2H2 [Penicillium griseofulvum]